MRRYTWKNTLPAWLALLYAMIAYWADWEPARTVVQLTSQWSGGYYEEMVVFSTWALLLAPILAAWALILWLDCMVRPSLERPPSHHTGQTCLVQYRVPRLFGIAIAIVAAVFGGVMLRLALVASSEIGQLVELALMVAPWLVLFACAHLLDAVLPSRWRTGMIDRLQVRPGQFDTSPRFYAQSGEREWRVDKETFVRLQVGQPMWVRYSVMWGYLRELRMDIAGYR